MLAPTRPGMSREGPIRLMVAWRQSRFADLPKREPDTNRLRHPLTIDDMFETTYHLESVDPIFRDIFE